jgi:hypothetical protein
LPKGIVLLALFEYHIDSLIFYDSAIALAKRLALASKSPLKTMVLILLQRFPSPSANNPLPANQTSLMKAAIQEIKSSGETTKIWEENPYFEAEKLFRRNGWDYNETSAVIEEKNKALELASQNQDELFLSFVLSNLVQEHRLLNVKSDHYGEWLKVFYSKLLLLVRDTPFSHLRRQALRALLSSPGWNEHSELAAATLKELLATSLEPPIKAMAAALIAKKLKNLGRFQARHSSQGKALADVARFLGLKKKDIWPLLSSREITPSLVLEVLLKELKSALPTQGAEASQNWKLEAVQKVVSRIVGLLSVAPDEQAQDRLLDEIYTEIMETLSVPASDLSPEDILYADLLVSTMRQINRKLAPGPFRRLRRAARQAILVSASKTAKFARRIGNLPVRLSLEPNLGLGKELATVERPGAVAAASGRNTPESSSKELVRYGFLAGTMSLIVASLPLTSPALLAWGALGLSFFTISELFSEIRENERWRKASLAEVKTGRKAKFVKALLSTASSLAMMPAICYFEISSPTTLAALWATMLASFFYFFKNTSWFLMLSEQARNMGTQEALLGEPQPSRLLGEDKKSP